MEKVQKGWECPKCHKILSPDQKECKTPTCQPTSEQTNSTSTLLNESR